MADETRPPRPGSTGPNAGPKGTVTPAAFAGHGIQFVVSILLFLYLGKWVDRKLGTEPVFLIVGVFVGAAAGFYTMIRALTAGLHGRGGDRGPRGTGGTREE